MKNQEGVDCFAKQGQAAAGDGGFCFHFDSGALRRAVPSALDVFAFRFARTAGEHHLFLRVFAIAVASLSICWINPSRCGDHFILGETIEF